jgi:hypothetical protein
MRQGRWRGSAAALMLILTAVAGGSAAWAADYVEFTKEHPLADAQADKALIYVVRPTSLGAAIKSFFFSDKEILGINRGNSYFFAPVAPGRHVFWSKSENVDALELDVQAGGTYYIQQHVQMGGFRARTRLEVLDEARGKEALAKCKKHGTLTDEGREKGAELVRDHLQDTREDLDRRAAEAAKAAAEPEGENEE